MVCAPKPWLGRRSLASFPVGDAGFATSGQEASAASERLQGTWRARDQELCRVRGSEVGILMKGFPSGTEHAAHCISSFCNLTEWGLSWLHHGGSFPVAHRFSLVVAHRLNCSRGRWDLSSLTRERTRLPCIAMQILHHWITRQVSAHCFSAA